MNSPFYFDEEQTGFEAIDAHPKKILNEDDIDFSFLDDI